MTYNVQNLFDDVKDGSEYSAYDPEGKSWSRDLYEAKMQAIARVITEAVPGGPDLLALQEVENRNVLEQLQKKYLKQLNYPYSVLVPVPGSATNTAFLSRSRVINVRAHNVSPGNGYALRNILEIRLENRGHELYVFNNHWKSKSEGAAETEPLRLEASTLLRGRILEILKDNPAADLIITGDLNETYLEYLDNARAYQTALIPFAENVPEEYVFQSLYLSGNPEDCSKNTETKVVLYEPWYRWPEETRGSYYYAKKWQTLDHCLLSGGLFDNTGFTYAGFRVVRKPFLLTPRSRAPRGWKKDKSGYSDHLPLLLELTCRTP